MLLFTMSFRKGFPEVVSTDFTAATLKKLFKYLHWKSAKPFFWHFIIDSILMQQNDVCHGDISA